MAVVGKVEIWEGETSPLLARVADNDGTNVVQSDVASIKYTVTDTDDPKTAGSTAAILKADVIFDTLQTGPLWTEDETGYNFLWEPASSLFVGSSTLGGRKRYQVEVEITPAGSTNLLLIVWLVDVRNTLGGANGTNRTDPTSGLGYCSRSDIEDVFGVANVATWADLDNNDDSQLSYARITKSIALATAEVDERLRGGASIIPFTFVPDTIVNAAANLAGVWLYESRGIDDMDPDTGLPVHKLAANKASAIRTLNDIRANRRLLTAPTTTLSGVNSPFIAR